MNKINVHLCQLLFDYCVWAKFDWCDWVIDPCERTIQWYDREEHKRVSQSYVLRAMLENGMLNEFFTQEELKTLYDNIPPRFKNEIKYYMEMNENE